MSAADEIEDASPELKSQRKGYYRMGFATGPDTIMLILWTIGVIEMANQDSTCAEFNGISSGADGQSCVDGRVTWNETLWQDVGGTACLSTSGFLTGEAYTHDPSLTGCAAALTAYRAVTSYTCNCSGQGGGDHAFSPLFGLRGENVVLIPTIAVQVLVGVSAPIFGSYIDRSSKRLAIWKYGCVLPGALMTFGMCVVFPGGLWIVGLAFALLTHIFTELAIVPRMSYLEDLAESESARGYLGGMRQAASYLSQLIYTLLVAAAALFLSYSLASVVTAAVCGIWFLVFSFAIFPYFKELPAKQQGGEGAFAALFREFTELKKYPEALKLLLVQGILCQNGAPVMVSLFNVYLVAELGFGFIETAINAVVILLVGTFTAFCFAKIKQKRDVPFKKLWIIIMLIFVFLALILPLVATRDKPYIVKMGLLVVLGGVFAALGLSWYYSIGWTSFSMMIPPGKAAQYGGLHTFMMNIFFWIEGAIYGAVFQATNSSRIAFATIAGWGILAVLAICMIDFEKGARDAGRAPAGKGAKSGHAETAA